MGVTIKDIAQAAGVCRATVDKVLHNRPGVSEELRQRVQQVIDELDYQPNLIGQALKRQQNRLCIAAVLLQLDSLDDLLEGVQEAAQEVRAFGVEVITRVTKYPDVLQQKRQLRELLEQQVDGVILTPLDDARIAEEIEQFHNKGIPVITINSDLQNSKRQCFVGQNMMQAGRTAAQISAMILGGKGNIAALTSSDLSYFSRGRLQGFLQYLSEHSDLQLVETADTQECPERMYRETKRILESRGDLHALYITCGCASDAVRAATDLDADVRIVCFDSFPENAAWMQQNKIDCIIDQELTQQGKQAVNLLFEHLVKGQDLPDGEVYMPIRIHIRENMLY